ncbi:MAG: NADPH-dependent FMN reductase [Steroidobacteraceae bacterium]
MAKIIGISGSLRRGSYNTALLRAAVAAAPADATIEVGSIRGIPLYDGDIEASDGIPTAARDLKEQIAAADGLLLVTPEYNNSIPGVFKNAIDWLSRPPADAPRIFNARPVAIMGTSPGRFGTLLSQTAWLPILRTLGMRPWYGATLYVSEAAKVFDATGNLIDPVIRERVVKFVQGFTDFVKRAAPPKP